MSWANLVDYDLTSNEQLFSNKFVDIPVDQIVDIDVKSIPDTQILKYQSDVANHLKKNVKSISKNQLLQMLLWLSVANNFMSDKLCLPAVVSRNSNRNLINRSSYKFCEYSYDCEFNYPSNSHKNKKNKTKGCYKQHFVYNILKNDIDSIIIYLENNDDININELSKCINTVSFVINRMKDEYDNLVAKFGLNSDIFYIEKKEKT